MKRLIPVMMVVLLVGALLAAGCGGSNVVTEAEKQIASAKAALDTAKELGVQIPANDQAKIATATGKLKSDSVQALILATEAKADIQNDTQDAVNTAKATFDTAVGAAETAISKAPAGTNLTAAQQSVSQAKTKGASAKTMDDWYNPSGGAIYFANLAAQQAQAAAVAQAGAEATAQEILRVQQGAAQMAALMRNYINSKGGTAANYKIGIMKISKDAMWATGSAAPVSQALGSSAISFLFQYENGQWVLRAAPSWTAGQFGSPADMLP